MGCVSLGICFCSQTLINSSKQLVPLMASWLVHVEHFWPCFFVILSDYQTELSIMSVKCEVNIIS